MVGFEHAPFLGTANGYTGILKWQSANTGPAGRLIAGAQIGAQIGTKIHGIFLPHANPKKKRVTAPTLAMGVVVVVFASHTWDNYVHTAKKIKPTGFRSPRT